ncbi:hypothetical protein BP5796_00885 [Coleophoma crateriformis]|uniref:DUF7908 domain-containing protein n=1 Tax=Coleophoma crateriformis TaxID=565419 RepID=A0A3D8T965_9HELO|nr:hypothetical protein BP5796_00885 [Coleophoma crateriformis]
MYLTVNGTATSTPGEAATCHISSTKLYCSSTVPIGAGTGDWQALLVPLQGKDSINTGWRTKNDGKLAWANARFENVNATFKFALGGSSGVPAGVYAVLGPEPITDLSQLTTPAELITFVPSMW